MNRSGSELIAELSKFAGFRSTARVKGVLFCKPMDDEPVWSHLGRIVKISGLPSGDALRPVATPKRPAIARLEAAWAILIALSEASDLTPEEYLHLHSAVHAGPVFDEKDLSGYDLVAAELLLSNDCLKHAGSQIRRCPDCVSADISQHGFCWFRRCHQLAGMDWCIHHRAKLEIARGNLRHFMRSDCFGGGGSFAPIPGFHLWSPATPAFSRTYVEVIAWFYGRQEQASWDRIRSLIKNKIPHDQSSRFLQAASYIRNAVLRTAPSKWFSDHFEEDQDTVIGTMKWTFLAPTPISRVALAMAALWDGPAEARSDLDSLLPM